MHQGHAVQCLGLAMAGSDRMRLVSTVTRVRHPLATEPHAKLSHGCGHHCQVSMAVAPPSNSSIMPSRVSWSQPPSRAHVLSAMLLTYCRVAAMSGGAILAAHSIYLYYHDYAYHPAYEIGRRGRVVYVGSATPACGQSRCGMQGTALSAPSIHLA